MYSQYFTYVLCQLNSQSIVSSKNTDNRIKHNLQNQLKLGRLSLSSGSSVPIVVMSTTVKPKDVISARRPLGSAVILGQVTPNTIISGRYNHKDLIVY